MREKETRFVKFTENPVKELTAEGLTGELFKIAGNSEGPPD